MEEMGGCVSVWAVVEVRRWGVGLSGGRNGGRAARTAQVLGANAEVRKLRGEKERVNVR